MFDWLFKRKKPCAKPMRTTEQIDEFIHLRRAADVFNAGRVQNERAEAIKRINQFPLKLPASELEISAACNVGWLPTLIAMRSLLHSGQWGHITIDDIPLLQRLW